MNKSEYIAYTKTLTTEQIEDNIDIALSIIISKITKKIAASILKLNLSGKKSVKFINFSELNPNGVAKHFYKLVNEYAFYSHLRVKLYKEDKKECLNQIYYKLCDLYDDAKWEEYMEYSKKEFEKTK